MQKKKSDRGGSISESVDSSMVVPGDGAGVWFSILGPLRAWRGRHELDLGPRQLRLMVALLLVRSGGPATVDEFTTLLWGENPPSRATNIIYRHVGSIRRILDPHLPPRAPGLWLERQGGGYRLNVDEHSSDLLRFRALAEAAQHAAAADQARALSLSLAALRLWNGRAAVGLDPDSAFLPEFTALDHERSTVASAAADVALTGESV